MDKNDYEHSRLLEVYRCSEHKDGFISMEVEDILKAEEEYSQWRDRDRMWLSKLMDK